MSLSKNISYYHSPQKCEFLYSTIPEQLKVHATTTPHKEAVVFINRGGARTSITCKDLHEKAILFAKGLIKLGVKSRDIVAISLPNSIEWLISTFGIQMIGAIPLHFMFHKKDGSDVIQTLAQAGNCSAILIDPGNSDIDWNICKQLIDTLQSNGSVTSKNITSLRYLVSLSHPDNDDYKGLLINDILNIGKENGDIELPVLGADDVAALMLTSGSTGAPKLVQYTHFTLLMFGYHLCCTLNLLPGDIFYNDRVFSWVVGYPTCFLYQGTTRVTVSKLLHFGTIQEIIQNTAKILEQEKCNVAIMIGTCIYEMLQTTFPSCKQWPLKTIATAGYPMPASYSQIAGKIANKFVISYGTTEVGCISALQMMEPKKYPDYTVGKPLPGVEVKIVDDQGEMVPLNTSGEILVRHSAKPLGYTDSEKTKSVFSPSGWFKTDDIGFMMEDGIFATTGRKSDVIISSGILVSPAYIEAELLEFEGVQAVVVTPIKNEKTFQDICACIIPKPGINLTVEMLENRYRGKYVITPAVRNSRPKYYLLFETFPKTPSGKISRNEVAKEARKKLDNMLQNQ